jgi:hypothetical protein
MDKEILERSSKEWRKGKIYSKKNNLFYYKTNSDSPFVLHRSKNPYPNIDLWKLCKYIDSNGIRCKSHAFLSEDDKKCNYIDHEIYRDVLLCKKHKIYETEEIEKRRKIIDKAKNERIVIVNITVKPVKLVKAI